MRKLALLAVAAVLLAGCGKSATTTSTAAAGTTAATGTPDAHGCVPVGKVATGTRNEPKATSPLSPTKTYTVTFVTNCGSFSVRLDQKQSPNTTASIVSLVKRGFFDKTIFHRIVPGFVIQGGDPTGTGTGGPGYQTVDKPPASATYTHGVVAMAKTGSDPPGTAGSQFFVVTAANAGLSPDYAIIGKVVRGLNVVDRIGKLGDANQQPTETVEIEKATVATS
jgi:cyclophilin family peptidyl-prolyl cis-trans isomerase